MNYFKNQQTKLMKGGFKNPFSMNTWFIIILVFLLVIIGIVFYYKIISSNKSFNANNEYGNDENNSNSNGSNHARLLLFYTTWCPHCKTAKPEWESIKNDYNGKNINGYILHFEEYDCTNSSSETIEMMNKFKIEGYPTIKLIKNNEIIEYDAKPKKETIKTFLDTVL